MQFLLGLVLLVVLIALGIALAPYILPLLGLGLILVVILVIGAFLVRGLDIAISYPLYWIRRGLDRLSQKKGTTL